MRRESRLAALTAAWSRPGTPASEVLEATRQALGAIRPGDLPEVAPLAETLLARLARPDERTSARRALFALLDGVRRRFFTAVLEPEAIDPWVKLVLRVIREADYAFGDLLRSREETDPKTVALRVLGADACELTVADVSRRTRAIARGLLALVDGDPDARVAILSESGLEAALCDLACLSNGIVDFPLPANAVAEQIVYMLRHSGARVLLASDDEQVGKVLPSLAALPELRDVVVLSRAAAERNGILSLEQMVSQGAEFDDALRAVRAEKVKATDVATVMYTSGTTGKPKGIVFTHENIVSKRFCRAFALPNVNEGDVFLCYLPPYHTFGRYLDLCGTLFWGATFVFARSTGQATLLEDFRNVRPTVFISVPKKWMELHETAVWEAGSDHPEDLGAHLRAITGGRLRYGLSAAGYLDPSVFRAFHMAGTALCSGYGMTEATGGITMTPPGEYVDGSIGKPLPGIECRLGGAGELLIRGPYVSPGYHDPGPQERGADADGWFATGDLVSVDPDGHFRIIGRKKEIYKNRQGQTIAPQRVENLFRDFETVSQAFLVGDQREFNTLLVWPNPASPTVAGKTPEQVRELLSSVVASANRFLAPFERVVAFQVLPRALDEEHGELTHKLSFKREAVEANWKPLIEKMYQRKHLALQIGGTFLRIPNWVLREIGVLQQEVSLDGNLLRADHRTLMVGAVAEAPGSMRVGDLAYSTEGVVDLGALLSSPSLWLGNEALRTFLGEEAFMSLVSRRRKPARDLRLDPRWWPPPRPERLKTLLGLVDRSDSTFLSIAAAGELLRAERPEARRAIAHLQLGLATEQPEYAGLCRALLRRAADAPDEEVRRLAFRALLPGEEPGDTVETLRLFLDRMGPFALRDEDLADLGASGLVDAQVRVLLAHLASDRANAAPRDPSDRRLIIGAMRLVTATAIAHPAYFARTRIPLARLALHEDAEIAARAREELDRLRRGFWNWIGPNVRLAIDPKTGAAYGWREVLAFDDDNVTPGEAQHLLQAIEDSTLVRGSVFLVGRGVLLSLADIPPDGAKVSLLGRQHGKSVYRLSIHTRAHEVFDVAINVAEDMNFGEFKEEVAWLLAAGAPPPLVEQFGGCFPEWGMFTEEFIPGDTVERQVARLVRQGETKRLRSLWPFLAWTALDAHVRFWDRTGRRLALREPSPAAFIVPSHDYQTGARLVSISDRTPCATLEELLDRFQMAFVARVEASRPELRGEVDESILLSGVVEALGLERGVALLSRAAQESKRAPAIEAFLERIRTEGFEPQRVWFAVRRYRRWLEVNPAATNEARGKMLGELWGTYGLADVEQAWPDTRLRFFRRTVFAGARPELGAGLDRLIARTRASPAGGADLEEHVAALRGAVPPTAEEDYFLARMTYRYLAPTDEVALISVPSGGHYVTEVVASVTDAEGQRFTIRSPASPREVARLLNMFHDANLHVTFTAEHEFLLCFDANEMPVGGLFYTQPARDRVHMEKVVVARQHRGGGVADGLMYEFFRRLRARGVRRVETGYFQPEHLSRYGFRTDPTSGGIVRELDPTQIQS